MVAGQRPTPVGGGRQDQARCGAPGRGPAAQGEVTEVLLRRDPGAAAGVGSVRRAVRALPGRVDAHPTGPAGTPRRTRRRYRPVQRRGARGVAGDEQCIDRPLPRAGESIRPDPRRGHHEAVTVAAVVDQGPQGRRRGRGRAGVLRRRHCRALRADTERRVRAHREPDLCAHRVGVHPHRAQQRPRPHRVRAERRRGRGAVPDHRPGLRLGVPPLAGEAASS